MTRIDGRKAGELRPIKLHRGYLKTAPGSVLIEAGDTRVLCTATIEEAVPIWRRDSGLGWVTAEYEMLPASTGERRARNRAGKIDGRTQEIQRIIGRSLRAVVDMETLGPRTIWIDCDVLQADGGTRTAGITGAYVALVDAVRCLRRLKLVRADPILDSVAAISVGLIRGRVLLDLCYAEDKDADVDFTVVATGSGRFVELQGTGEGATFDRTQMDRMLAVANKGLRELRTIQERTLRTSFRGT
ncbi:MAG TPA: ribonuclease PH [Phycisphaerae bacterium]|nr:ribonuclease PH [Phycisphaerae bacterium]